jgi:hypothetical protein
MRFQAGCGTISNRSTVHDRWGSPISTFIIVTDRVSASLARTASGSSSRVNTSTNGMDARRLRSLLLAERESQRHVTGKAVSRIALPHRSRVMQPSAQLDFTENRARKRNWSDRISGSARFLGVQRGDLPDGVFLYVDLIFKSTVERGIPSLAAARFAPETRSLNLAGAKLPGKKAGNQCSGNVRWNSMIS